MGFRWTPVPALALALAALLAVPGAAAQDRGKDGDGKKEEDGPPAKVEEKELEGDEKKAHELEVRKLLWELQKEKNKNDLTNRIEQLGADGSRASRDALMQYSRGNKNHEYVTKAFDALSRIGGPVVLNFLCEKDALQAYNNFLVQIAAANALGKMGDARATGTLLKVIEFRRSKIEVISACCHAVAKVNPRDPKVRETVLGLTRTKDDTTRANAVESLGDLGGDDAYARLLEVLEKDGNTRVRGAACTGLKLLGRREAVEALRKAAKEDKAQTVRDLANEAITHLGG